MKENKKKIKEAAALKFSPETDDAPKLVAAGKGVVAEKIIEKAKKNNIPIHENAELSHELQKMNISSEIPPELYEIVAAILAFVAKIDYDYD